MKEKEKRGGGGVGVVGVERERRLSESIAGKRARAVFMRVRSVRDFETER